MMLYHVFRSEASGAQRSSELVLRLNGSSEATEGMFEMIFSRSEGMPNSLCTCFELVNKKGNMGFFGAGIYHVTTIPVRAGNDSSTAWSRTAASMIAPVLKAVVSPLRTSMEKENQKTGKVRRRRSFLSSISEIANQVTPRKTPHQFIPPSPSAWTPTRASTAWSVQQVTP